MSYFDDASLVMIPSGYKTSKVYSVKPTDGSGDLTFSRSNDTATRVNSAGLIEKVRTNLILQSQDFSTTWSANSCSVSTNTTANPLDGAVNADTITFAGGTTQKYVIQAFSFNGNYTASVYLKAGTNQFVQFLLGSDASAYVNFDLVNATYSAVGSVANMVSVGSGWYRCSMSFTSTIGTHVFIQAVNSLAAARFDATTSTGTLIAFGYQLETGDIATSYIATTSAAVSVGPVANVPRLDYLNSSCPRLLLEPQRTSLVTFSESFDNAAWSKDAVSVSANASTSPDGYVNADSIVENSATGFHFIQQTFTSSAVSTTYSIFAKLGSGTRTLILREGVNTGAFAAFNLSTGVVAAQSGGTATITQYANGYYRCTLTFTAVAGTSSMQIALSNANSFASYAGNGTSSIIVYGAQVEAGAYATSYIPTLGAAVTRGADACSKTGISSLIGQTEGTFFAEVTLLGNTGNFNVLNTENTTTNSITLHIEGSQVRGYVYANSALRNSIIGGSLSVGNTYKMAYAYKSGDAALYLNGVQIGTASQTWAFSASVSKIELADPDTYFSYQEGIKFTQALLFKTRLTNAQLAELTTI